MASLFSTAHNFVQSYNKTKLSLLRSAFKVFREIIKRPGNQRDKRSDLHVIVP